MRLHVSYILVAEISALWRAVSEQLLENVHSLFRAQGATIVTLFMSGRVLVGDMAPSYPRASSGGYAVVVVLFLSIGTETDIKQQGQVLMHQPRLMALD